MFCIRHFLPFIFFFTPFIARGNVTRFESLEIKLTQPGTNRLLGSGMYYIKLVQAPELNSYVWYNYQLTGNQLVLTKRELRRGKTNDWVFRFVDTDEAIEEVPVEKVVFAQGLLQELKLDRAFVNSTRQVSSETWTAAGGSFRGELFDYRNKPAMLLEGQRKLLSEQEFQREIAYRQIINEMDLETLQDLAMKNTSSPLPKQAAPNPTPSSRTTP